MSLLYEPSVADLTAHYFDNPVDFYHAPQESLNRLSYAQYATLKEMDSLWKNVPPPVEPTWWPWLIQHGTAKSMTTFHSWGNSLDESSLHAMASREYKEKKAIVPDSLYREAIEVFQDHDKKPHAYELIAGAHIKSRLSMLLESQKSWCCPFFTFSIYLFAFVLPLGFFTLKKTVSLRLITFDFSFFALAKQKNPFRVSPLHSF